MVFHHAKDRVEAPKDGQNRIAVTSFQLPLIHRRVCRAQQIEDGRPRLGGVQVVLQRGEIIRLRRSRRLLQCRIFAGLESAAHQPLAKCPQPIDGAGGFYESVEGEVHLMPVRHRNQREANRGRLEAFEQQVAQRIKVALALGHLAPVHEQKPHMHPMACKWLVRDALALRNLVFVVREHQVFAAGVQVEALAQKLHSHGRALQMPSRPPAANGRIPRCLAGLGGLPQRKISRRIFLVLIQIDARAVFHPGQIFFAQLAILGKGSQTKVPASVLCLVSRSRCSQLLDQLDHAWNVLSGASDDFRVLDAQRVHILKKSPLKACRILADGDARRRSVADDLVVHVGNVHYMENLDARQLEKTPQHVHLEKSAEVADVAVVINGRAAGVHTQRLAVGGRERVDLSRKSIEKPQSHQSNFLPVKRLKWPQFRPF